MKTNPFAGKSSRTKIFTVITVVAIILLLGLNLLVTSLSIYGTAYIDMTPEGLYTVRPVMEEFCKQIFYMDDGSLRDPGIKITFCDDPDHIIQNDYTRVVYYMALSLSKKFENLTVETVNVNINPTAVAEYKTTSLTEISPSDVIISYGSRYRIVGADEFWVIGSEKVYSFDGEYKLASILLSLTLVDRPVAYFVTNHGEDYFDPNNPENPGNLETSSLAALLEERGLEIKALDLEAEREKDLAAGESPKIPEDCVLLIINNPKTDFKTDKSQYGTFSYVSEMEMVDRFMTDGRGAVMVAKDYRTEGTLPVFEDFLKEWGIVCSGTLVKDEESFLESDGEEHTLLVTDYNKNEASYGYAIYGEYASLSSAPRVVIGDTGHISCAYGENVSNPEAGTADITRIFAPFLFSSPASVDYGKNAENGKYVDRNTEGVKNLAVVASRQVLNNETGEYTHSYLFCAASADFFADEYLANASYANYDVVSGVVQSMARLNTYAPIELGGVSNNDDYFLGKKLVEMKISESDTHEYEWNGEMYVISDTTYGLTGTMKTVYAVIAAVIPLSVAVVGVIVCVRRKYL